MSGRNIKIIIAGGGTGGHVFPAIAIANALKEQQPGIEILFVGAKGKMEMEKVPQAGYEIKGLHIAGFNRSSLLKNIGLPFKLIKSFFQVRQIIDAFKPDAVIGVGGYSTYPVLKYAQFRGIRSFIHESNSFAGKSNMMLGKNATWIFTATGNMEKFFPKHKITIAGNPVRKTIAQSTVTKKEAFAFFGLNEHKKTILAIGGSLGARSINEALSARLDDFAANDLQLIWQTGKTTEHQYKMKAEGKENIWCEAFIEDMSLAYAAADIIISRSGSTVYELCVVGKPVILVPFPLAAEDHQTANAMNLVTKNAGILVKDSETREKLVNTAISLTKDEVLQQTLKTNIHALAITNADEIIAKEILEHIK